VTSSNKEKFNFRSEWGVRISGKHESVIDNETGSISTSVTSKSDNF
jgi:hypothetical protein